MEIETEKLPLAAEEEEEEGGGGREDGKGGSLLSPMGEEGKRRNVLHFNRHINLRRDN